MAERLDNLGTIVRQLALLLDEYLSQYTYATNKWRDKDPANTDAALGAIPRVCTTTIKHEALKLFDFSDAIIRGDFMEHDYEELKRETWSSIQRAGCELYAVNMALPGGCDVSKLFDKYGEFCRTATSFPAPF